MTGRRNLTSSGGTNNRATLAMGDLNLILQELRGFRKENKEQLETVKAEIAEDRTQKRF